MVRKLIKLFPAVALCLYACSATSEPFQSEISLGTSFRDSESQRFESDHQFGSLGYAFFLHPIHNEGGPLAESAFLAKASFVEVLLTHGSEDYTSKRSTSGEIDSTNSQNSIDLSGRAVFLERAIIDVQYSDDLSDEHDTSREVSLGGGLYVSGFSVLTLKLSRSTIDFESSRDVELDSVGIQSKTVFPLASGQSLRLTGDLTRIKQKDASSQRQATLSLTYFPNKRLGIGTDYLYGEIGNVKHREYGVDVGYFFTPRWNLAASYSRANIDDAGDLESDLLTATLSGRY